MDDTLKAEFPIGKATVIVSEPAPGQKFVLALSRVPEETDDVAKERLMRRLLRVLEAIIGEQQWYDVVEDGLISLRIQPQDLFALALDVLQFDWAAHHAVKSTEEVSPPAGTEARPAPRIVSGG